MYHVIHLIDNTDFLSTLDNPKSYNDAKGGNDKFEIWRDVYQQDYVTNGVLEANIKPFEIGQAKSSIADLKEIAHDEVQKNIINLQQFFVSIMLADVKMPSINSSISS